MRDPPPVLVVCCGALRQIAVDGMTECPECGALHRVTHEERPSRAALTDGGTEESDREQLFERLKVTRNTDDPTPAVALKVSQADGAHIALEAGEGWSDFTAELRFYQPEELRLRADRLRDGADWIERYQDTGSDREGGRSP